MDFQPVREEVNLHRGALCIDAVIPVDQGVEHRFPDGSDGIFGLVSPLSGFRVNDGAHLHVPLAESQGFLYHGGDGAFDALVVEKTGLVIR